MTIHPWDKQPRESSEAYAAFCVYRDLGPSRTLAAAYRAYREGTQKRLRGTFSDDAPDKSTGLQVPGSWKKNRISGNWNARAEAYDAHLLRSATEARASAAAVGGEKWLHRRDEQREYEWQLRSRAAKLIDRELTRLEGSDPSSPPSIGEVLRLVDMAVKVGRLACEMETDRTASNPAPAAPEQPLAELSDEQLEALIHGQARP